MRSKEIRHYTEEELLMHVLHEESPEYGEAIETHLEKCGECQAVRQEYLHLVKDIQGWPVEDLAEGSWLVRKNQLLEQFRSDPGALRRKGLSHSILKGFHAVWDYALENPLPTMGYIAVAIAFAVERTVSVFRLDRILPATSEVFELIRQML